MFVHQGKLDPLLSPRDYCSEDVLAAEQRNLFRRHWHIVGPANDLEKPGDYLARELQGVPIVVRNDDGKIRAFKNACAHRHSMLTPLGKGNQPQLTCQYHGWQYQADGRVSKVPDGQSFKGIKADRLCLSKVAAETCGPFVCASLDPAVGSFHEHLGSFAAEFDYAFGRHRHFGTWQTEHAVNWKVIVENAVESYHVPLVHPTTFRDYRSSELHDHRLEASYSRYLDLQPWDRSLVSRGFKTLAALLLHQPNYERFKHTHVYPNHLLYYGDLMSTWTVVEPLSAHRSRYTLYAFVPADVRWGAAGRLLQQTSSAVLMRQLKKILGEDMDLWPKVQGGLEASEQQGVLSCREERIWAFQNYLKSFAGDEIK